MKETVEQAANSIGGVHPDWSRLECFRMGLKEGAEWQSRQSPWISIDDKFPDDKSPVLCSSSIYGKVVLCWDELSQTWSYPESFEFYCDWNKIDCWMNIP